MKPLILYYAINRKEEVDSVYEYDFTKSVNTVLINSEKKMFIDATPAEISSLTRRLESGSNNNDSILELRTKTEEAGKRMREKRWAILSTASRLRCSGNQNPRMM